MHWLFLLAFPIIFVLLWCSVCYVLSIVGGWSVLANQFRTDRKPAGKTFYMQSGRLGWVNYNHCLTMIVGRKAMYLGAFFLFRVGHPPLSIPWSAFHNLRRKKLLFWDYVVADVGSPAIRLTLPLNVLEHKPVELPDSA